MKTTFLSSRERERGTRAYLAHALFNGAGFTFLADTTVALMALSLGADNTQLGYIGSVVHLSGLALPFVPVLFTGMNIANVYFYTWLARGLICSLYFVLPFLKPGPAMTVLLFVYTAFNLTRAFGASMAGPVQRALSTRASLGALIARLSVRFNVSALVARVISTTVLRVPQLAGMAGLLVLEFFGIVSNTLSAIYLRKLGVRERVERVAGLGVLGTFITHVRRKGVFVAMLLNWLAILGGIMMSFTVVFLKRGVGWSDSTVFVYSVGGSLAAIAAGMAVTPFVDRVGSGVLLSVSNVFSALLALIWAIIPTTLAVWVFVALGFITVFSGAVGGLAVSRVLVGTMPDQERVSYTAMYSFFGALVALGGGFAAGALTNLGAHVQIRHFHPYSFAYLAAAVLCLAAAITARFVHEKGNAGIREAAGILFSFRNLRDFLDLYQLDTTSDPVKRETILAAIEQSDTDIATAELASRLKSPLTAERERTLKSLFTHSREELLDDILAEAGDVHSHIRATAMFALGAYRDPRVEPFLIALLDDPDDTVRSTAAKSLARIGNTSELERVSRLACQAELSTISRINYAIALTLMDREGTHLRRLFEMAPPEIGARSAQSVFSTYTRFLQLSPALSDFLHAENLERGSGLDLLLDEAREVSEFLRDSATLAAWYRRRDYEPIWKWCRERLGGRSEALAGAQQHVADAIEAWDTQRLDDTNTVAAVYFTYQILRSPAGW